MNMRAVNVFLVVASFLAIPLPATAQSLNGTYVLVKDSDGQAPKKKATVKLTFKGGNSGTLAMSAVQPGETVTDTGKYVVQGSSITMHFKEMEWDATRQPFSLDGCTLTLPFKALGGSPGPGRSTWSKEGCIAGTGIGSTTRQASSSPDQALAQNPPVPYPQQTLPPQEQQKVAQPGDKRTERPTRPERPTRSERQERPERPARPVCGCRDIDNLHRRGATVAIALEKYMEFVLKYEKADEATGKPTMYSAKEVLETESYVQWAIENIDKLNTPFKPSAPGETGSAASYGKSTPKPAAATNGGDCSITIKNADSCRYAVLESHEKVHQADCRAYHAEGKLRAPWDSALPGRHADYKDGKTMAEYAKEEVRAYQAEAQRIEIELARLKSCWVCDVDKKAYTDASVCEASCRPTLGSTIKPFGHRCEHPK